MGFDFQFNTQTVGDYHNVYTLSWLKLSSGKYKISRVPRKTYRGGYTIKYRIGADFGDVPDL